MPKPAFRLPFAVTILLVGANLRPSLASIGPLLAPIQRDTGLGDTAAGLLTSLPVLLMGLCLLGTGRLYAALGGKGGVAAGLAAIGLAGAMRWLWPSGPALLASAVAGGVGIAVVQALLPAIIRSRAGSQSAAMMGLYSTAIMGGAAIASFVAPRIASAHGWAAAAGIWAVPAFAALAIWWSTPVATQPRATPAPAAALSGHARMWLLLAFFGLGTGAYALVLAWLPPFYVGLGWSAQDAGGLLGGLTLAEVAAGTGVALAVAHCHDRRPLILLAIGALFAGMACLCLAPLSLAWSAAMLCGLGIGALFPLGLIVALDHGRNAPDAARILGFVQGGGYLLAAVLPLIAGALRQHLANLAPAWWLMAALCPALALMALRLRPGTYLD